jgi:hypothetical protein
MTMKDYIKNVIYGITLGYSLDKLIIHITNKYKFSNALKLLFHIICIIIVIYFIETNICTTYPDWKGSGCGTLFFLSFFSMQVNLFADIYNVLENFNYHQ